MAIVAMFIIVISEIKKKYKIREADMREAFSTKSEQTLVKTRSPYQRIEVLKMKKPISLGKCLVLDNEVQLCTVDEHKYHELMIHFPVQYLDHFKNVLIIGGGDLMNLREVMKYETIKKVEVLELDPKVIATCEKYFKVSQYSDDHRVRIQHGDAAQTIKNIKGKFDLIILDLTESLGNNVPVGKFSFLKTCKHLLADQGVLVMNGRNNQTKLKKLFKYTYTYGCFLKTFEEFYEYVICSDKCDFPDIRPKNAPWKEIPTKFYKRSRHASYFNWYSVAERDHV